MHPPLGEVRRRGHNAFHSAGRLGPVGVLCFSNHNLGVTLTMPSYRPVSQMAVPVEVGK